MPLLVLQDMVISAKMLFGGVTLCNNTYQPASLAKANGSTPTIEEDYGTRNERGFKGTEK